ncbi:WXG100 family type VII secretion target [Rhodococcus cercidiphylli]|uniref:WXG100 family type VII secretion target n=1 Tax=Rhodococcus cercidiphylli TaxID=489916 RepID=UPI00374F2682
MTARYVADVEQILALVDRAHIVGATIESAVAEVEREVNDLGIEWEGEAAEAHRSKHELLRQELNDMRTALAQLGTLARGAHDRYRAAVDHNKRMWPRWPRSASTRTSSPMRPPSTAAPRPSRAAR